MLIFGYLGILFIVRGFFSTRSFIETLYGCIFVLEILLGFIRIILSFSGFSYDILYSHGILRGARTYLIQHSFEPFAFPYKVWIFREIVCIPHKRFFCCCFVVVIVVERWMCLQHLSLSRGSNVLLFSFEYISPLHLGGEMCAGVRFLYSRQSWFISIYVEDSAASTTRVMTS